ncbi:hypothetical protein CBM2589_A90351 [Cupriavidus taiwanensis]|uniref:Uncharacterized protein n=1 Tax=Cupriavidus taiwanensis TaxID=164546 RepID=A0A975XIM3_9BURK|nr:hypothetical protein [Cupriavidus taiwanensis]SOY68881.1 hypothetical protein CBM2589_A90351 [Cupriavidus taiwanensis]
MTQPETGSLPLRAASGGDVERNTIRHITWHADLRQYRLRRLQMNEELGMGPEMFGFAAGIFQLGYIGFEMPSNMLMHRLGARIMAFCVSRDTDSLVSGSNRTFRERRPLSPSADSSPSALRSRMAIKGREETTDRGRRSVTCRTALPLR